MSPIKLGILQVNHDKTVEVGDTFPDDAHRFRDLFDEQEQRFRYRVYMTIGGELPDDIDEQDAYLITGSPLSVLDEHNFTDALMAFIRKCDKAKKPLIGACFGHQAIALALGGKVARMSQGYNVGIEGTHFPESRSWMEPASPSLSLFVFHEDEVTELPPGCDLLGSSNNCRISSFAKGDHIFTTQGHPEFTHSFMNCLLDYTESKIPSESTNSARSSLEQRTQGDIFAQWCTQFIRGSEYDR